MSDPLRVDALALIGDRVAHVGSLEACRSRVGRDHEEYDLDGRALLPGFVDPHAHPLMLGQTATWVDVGPDLVPSIQALVALLAERARQLPPGVPLRAFGYDFRRLAERRHPTNRDLDHVATDREVYVMNVSGHGAVVNSYTLAAHGITAETLDIRGGEVGRNPDGTPNGLFSDAACDLLTGSDGVKLGNHGPNIHMPDTAENLKQQLIHAVDILLAAGITTVLDAQVTARETRVYLDARDDDRLRMRVGMLGISAFLDEALTLNLPNTLTTGMLTFNGVKLYADGAFGCATVYMPDGYLNDRHNHGILYHEPAEFQGLLYRAHLAGLPTGTHAQSSEAIELAITAIEKAQQQAPRPDIRHAIEHCSMPTDDQISRMAKAGIIPKSQPQHHLYFGDGLFELVGDLTHRYNPIGLYQRAGIPVVLSSDAPVVPPRPLEAVQAAVEHRTDAGRRLGDPALQIDTITALKGYTINAAFAMHREHDLGSLASGKLADLAILTTDPTNVPTDQISKIRVEETWVAGEPAYG